MAKYILTTADWAKKVLFFLPIFFLSIAYAETFQCKVIGITDGDTIKCLNDQKKQIEVRLYQIDAPESGQAYGQKAKQALSDLIFGKEVLVETHGIDQYKRTLGTIIYRDFKVYQICEDAMSEQARKTDQRMTWECNLPMYDINLEMIKQGYAWYYPFTKKNPDYLQVEQEAKKAKLGLWPDPKPVAPWEWRKSKGVIDLQEIDLCVNFPTKLNPDGCPPKRKKAKY